VSSARETAAKKSALAAAGYTFWPLLPPVYSCSNHFDRLRFVLLRTGQEQRYSVMVQLRLSDGDKTDPP
jgi:hypothetical protein